MWKPKKEELKPRTGPEVFRHRMFWGLAGGAALGLPLAMGSCLNWMAAESNVELGSSGAGGAGWLAFVAFAAAGLLVGAVAGYIGRRRLDAVANLHARSEAPQVLHDDAVVLEGEIDPIVLAYLHTGAVCHAKRLCMSGCTGLVDEVATAARCWDELSEIELLDCATLSSAFLRTLRRPPTRRVILALLLALPFADQSFWDTPLSLKRLVINGCPLVGDHGMKAIKAWKGGLKSLELVGLPLLTSKTRKVIDKMKCYGFSAKIEGYPGLDSSAVDAK